MHKNSDYFNPQIQEDLFEIYCLNSGINDLYLAFACEMLKQISFSVKKEKKSTSVIEENKVVKSVRAVKTKKDSLRKLQLGNGLGQRCWTSLLDK